MCRVLKGQSAVQWSTPLMASGAYFQLVVIKGEKIKVKVRRKVQAQRRKERVHHKAEMKTTQHSVGLKALHCVQVVTSTIESRSVCKVSANRERSRPSKKNKNKKRERKKENINTNYWSQTNKKDKSSSLKITNEPDWIIISMEVIADIAGVCRVRQSVYPVM